MSIKLDYSVPRKNIELVSNETVKKYWDLKAFIGNLVNRNKERFIFLLVYTSKDSDSLEKL